MEDNMNNNVTETEVNSGNSNSGKDLGIAIGLLTAAGYGVYCVGRDTVNKIRTKHGKEPIGVTSLFKRKKKTEKTEVKVADDSKDPKSENKSK